MRRILISALIGAVALGAAAAMALSAGGQGGGPATLSPVPVTGKPVGHGLKLTVRVYYARSGKNGHHGPPTSGSSCPQDVNTQTAYALFGKADTGGLHFAIDPTYSPVSASSFEGAVSGAFGAWNSAVSSKVVSYFSDTENYGAAKSPAQDGTNVIGWARLVPKNVLAATWSYQDASGRIVEADLFFNTSQKWAVLDACGGSKFDIGDVATHELGHALGLDHVSDPGKMATMYPSAPAGEILKRTLTAGDSDGALVALN